MAGNTTNAIGVRLALFAVANGSRTKVDGFTMGFAATPSANTQEVVLSPTVGEVSANVVTLNVNSVIFIRCSGRIQLTVTKADTTSYVQVVNAVFSMSPDGPVTIAIKTFEAFNVSCRAVWS